jgi:outer membrane protein
MNNVKRICLAIFMVVMLGLIALPAMAEEKIAFFSLDQVMRESVEGKKALEALTKVADKSKAAVQEKEEELKKLKDELDKQRSLMKADVLKEKETAFQKKIRDYQLLVKDSNEELQGKQQEIAKEFYPEIMKIVRAIGEKEKYTLIIDVSTFPLAYWDKTNDLTKRILDEFNKTFKPRK